MSEKKLPTGGGRKGGTQFPEIPLKKAVEFANKLVAKVHTGSQPENVILKGVFNSSGSDGKIRASALKQYDLMTGLSSAYDATDLARAIHSAPQDELPPLLAKACLSPKLFKTLYDTFQNDVVSRAKIRQQALQLKVHPETGEKCVTIFIESLLHAGLGTEQNGEIAIMAASRLVKAKGNTGIERDTSAALEMTDETNGEENQEPLKTPETPQETGPKDEIVQNKTLEIGSTQAGPQFQVALNLDTMDPEKLEKHMKILKRYGVIG